MDKFQLFPDQASTLAPQVDYLYFYLCGVTVFFTALIAILVIVFAVKYRRKSEADRPEEVHPSKILEIVWIVIPFILVMVMFAWGAVIFVNYSTPPANCMEINVIGKQWMWKVQHPDSQREINELHVPLGQPVKLIMTSEDVIHDFSIPAFRVKMDVVPGRYTTEWFQATKVGEYHLFCDQYCGTEHSRMVGKVTVMEPGDYQAWLAGQVRGLTPVDAGRELFQQYACVKCHSQWAPTMANLYGSKLKVWQDGQLKEITADEDYLRDSIINPAHQIVDGYGEGSGKANMPSFKDQLSEEQILQLVAYIKSLGEHEGKEDSMRMRNSYVPPVPAAPDMNGLLTK
jgi:cytochrome c oxidase subunit 2